jgi:ceramide glucosyltransferase
MDTLLALTLAVACFSLTLTAVTHASASIILGRERTSRRDRGISVLKPLKGEDEGLYENLASIARQNYERFEILFGCEDADDPALAVARRVQRDFPHVPMRVLSGPAAVGQNPKVNTLRLLSSRASYDCVLVSDSNVRARPDYLAAMAAELDDPSVGLVSSVLVGEGEQNLGALLDNLHMNTCIVRGVCGAKIVVNHPCVIGKSMLFRLSDLERVGGFALVDDVLAEDYVLGRAFRDNGFRVALSAHRLEAVTVQRSMKDFFARHVRWSQMRRRLLPGLYLFEPMESPIPWILLSALLVAARGHDRATGPLLLALGVGLSFRLLSDGALAAKLRGKSLGPRDYAAIVLKDVLFLAIWAVGGIKRTVSWRGNRRRIVAGSRLLPLDVPERREAALEGA